MEKAVGAKLDLERRLDKAYLSLAKDWALWQGELAVALQRVTEVATESLEVERASVWELNDDSSARELFCLDLYQRSKKRHDSGLHLDADRYPAYFRSLDEGRVVDAHDAATDPRTAEFLEEYLVPQGIGAMLDATLRRAGETCGVVCMEHVGGARLWREEEQHFLVNLADLVSQLLLYHEARQERQRYRALYDSAGDAILLLQDDRFTDCNDKALDIYGCRRTEIIGESPLRFSPPLQPDGRDSAEKAAEKISDALSGNRQFFEWRHLRGDGTPFDAEVTLNRLDLRGKPHLLAIVRDVTDRKMADRALRESQANLIQRTEHLQILNSLAASLSGAHDVEVIAREAISTLVKLSRAPSVAFLELLSDGRYLRIVEAHGFEAIALTRGSKVKAAGLAGLALERGEVLFSENLAADPRVMEEAGKMVVAGGYRAGIVIPLMENEVTFGEIFLGFREQHRPDESELELLRTVGKTVSMSLATASRVRHLAHQASHDSLTDLPNRDALHEYANEVLQRAAAEGGTVALCLLDLDRFKEINDTLGHQLGDQALIHIAERLKASSGPLRTTAFRLGGDEFALLIEGIEDESLLHAQAEQILERIRRPFEVDSMSLELSGSLGIALFPDHGDNSHDLLRCADVAMYQAKGEVARVQLYDPEKDLNTPERLALMVDLGSAIRDHQLLLHYQPKIHLQQGIVTGCEALVRWRHPRLGLVPPDKFIPLAEMSDLMRPLTEWVIEEALQAHTRWREKGIHLPVSVNLSTRNLLDRKFPAQVEAMLERYAIAGANLELEITESALMGNPELALEQAGKLAALGIRLSVDDFGTGYSSLSYLKQLQPETLKIDRSFVRDMLSNETDLVIVRSTIVLAHGLGMAVVAEGIETQESMVYLIGLNCDQAQGYHIGKPLAEEEFLAWLERASWRMPD
ncbi:MAG: hypothetical protein Kow006_17480 [Gammaproteobacteria bacterium]